MIRIRPAATRGRFRNNWLDAHLSFSFGGWRDPAFDGYSDLLVLNEDRVAPGAGFATHPHADVEVMSYPLAGAVEHRDSLGHHAVMRPGDVHLMRAGSGIEHSEMNASAQRPERHLQWWIRPWAQGLRPAYQRLHVPLADKLGRWRLLAAPIGVPGGEGALALAQDARVWAAVLQAAPLTCRPRPGRRVHLHVARGAAVLNGHRLAEGDGVFADGEAALTLVAADPGGTAEVLLFDLRGG